MVSVNSVCLDRFGNPGDTRGAGDANVYSSYRYNGTGRLVLEDYTGPEVRLDYADDYDGQHTGGTYEGFDRYGRVINHLWRDYDGDAYLDRYAYTYDDNSNRTWRENNGPSASGKDEKYTYDDLNRLTKTERGDRNGDAVDDPNREETFTLDQVGNWKTYLAKADTGGGLATEADHDRAVNDANEITGLTQRTGSWDEPAYDARGNMTTVPLPDDPANAYTCVYDAWNRLVEVTDGERVHARYEYDGLNRRVKAHVDSDASGGPDTWVHFYYTNDWRLLETRSTTAAENTAPETLQPGRQYVWSVRYTDALVRRDTNDDTDDLCDDETLYALGDANFNVTALVDGTPGSGTFGDVVERYVYDPYGNVTIYDDDWSDTRASSSYAWTVLFAGYWRDTETGLYHVRNRMYHVRLGLWLIRDPQGYVDGMSLYEYTSGNPGNVTDPTGLAWVLNDKKHLVDVQGFGEDRTVRDYGQLKGGRYLTDDQMKAIQAKLKESVNNLGQSEAKYGAPTPEMADLAVNLALATGQTPTNVLGAGIAPYKDPETGAQSLHNNPMGVRIDSLQVDIEALRTKYPDMGSGASYGGYVNEADVQRAIAFGSRSQACNNTIGAVAEWLGPLFTFVESVAQDTPYVAIAIGSNTSHRPSRSGEIKRVETRTTRSGQKGARIIHADGTVKDITPSRVKAFVPNTHPRAPAGTLQRMKFPEALPGSKGFKRAPTPTEIKSLENY